MSAATSNSSSATELGGVFVISPDVDAPFEPGQAVGFGFPARGPVLISA